MIVEDRLEDPLYGRLYQDRERVQKSPRTKVGTPRTQIKVM